MSVPDSSGTDNPYRRQFEHIRKIWRRQEQGRHLYGIERWTLFALACFLTLMPAMVVKWFFARFGLHARKVAIEVYAVSKPVLLLLLLACGSARAPWAFVVAAVFLIDLYSFLFGIILLREFWSRPFSYSRSLIMLAFNFVEFNAAFAVFYTFLRCLTANGAPVHGWSNVFYFTVATSSTVGFGDITPLPGIGRLLVTAQILGSMGMMALLVASFVGKLDYQRTPVDAA